MDRVDRVIKERERERGGRETMRKWTETRDWVAGRGCCGESGGGTWRVNASTSKWLAGTIIALNALVATVRRAVVHTHMDRADKTHTRPLQRRHENTDRMHLIQRETERYREKEEGSE